MRKRLIMDWETEERMPRIYGAKFKVVVNNNVRSVFLGRLGGIFFTDCTNPLSNMYCDEDRITAWKLDESSEKTVRN